MKLLLLFNLGCFLSLIFITSSRLSARTSVHYSMTQTLWRQYVDTLPPARPTPPVEEVFAQSPFIPDIPQCKDVVADTSRVDCFSDVLMAHIYKHLEYPELAVQHGVRGTVVIQFQIRETDKTYCARVLRDIGAQTGKSALAATNRALEELLKEYQPCQSIWNRRNFRGMLWNIPVKFKR